MSGNWFLTAFMVKAVWTFDETASTLAAILKKLSPSFFFLMAFSAYILAPSTFFCCKAFRHTNKAHIHLIIYKLSLKCSVFDEQRPRSSKLQNLHIALFYARNIWYKAQYVDVNREGLHTMLYWQHSLSSVLFYKTKINQFHEDFYNFCSLTMKFLVGSNYCTWHS